MPASDAADHHQSVRQPARRGDVQHEPAHEQQHAGEPRLREAQPLVTFGGEEGVAHRPQGSHVLSRNPFVLMPTD
jgi:hypothetical protein